MSPKIIGGPGGSEENDVTKERDIAKLVRKMKTYKNGKKRRKLTKTKRWKKCKLTKTTKNDAKDRNSQKQWKRQKLAKETQWKRWKLTKNGELYFLLHLCAGFRQGRVFNNTAEKEIFIYLFKIFSLCWNKSMYKWWLVKSALFICYCWWPSGFSYRCANDSDFCNNSFDFCQNNCDHCRTNCDLRKMLICELQRADLHQRVFSFFDGVSLKENHF